MSKFNQPTTRPAAAGPIVTATVPSGRTNEGALGYARDLKSELFLLAVSNMVGEDSFYEQAGDRDNRYTTLVRQVATADAGWMLEFITWLRGTANMRSAAIVAAAEAVHARLATATLPPDDLYNLTANRALISAALQRADEPGELLAYWTSRYGRAIPKPVKRGLADAVNRLWDEYAMLKYDTGSHGFRFGDVLDLTHPTPATPSQGTLFSYALARRHNRTEIPEVDGRLPMILANHALRSAGTAIPELLLDGDRLRAAGMTWEDALSLAGSKVDKARLWTALIPSMGYMALLRNLRNFDEAGVSDDVAATVAARLADPAQVAQSRQFPFRFLSAYRAVSNLRWSHALEKALTASLANVPQLPGRTLILVDQSPSMFPQYAHMHSAAVRERVAKTGITLADQAALFGVALAFRCADPLVVQYGTVSEVVQVPRGSSVLPLLQRFRQIDGTDTFAAARKHYAGHDRVVIVTDEQTTSGQDPIPHTVPVYTWNLGGYQLGHLAGDRNRHTLGGLTDAAFRMIPLLEAGRNASWPWLN